MVSTAASLSRPSWTSIVLAALILSGLQAFLPRSSRL
jgi:hypothetical protein